MRVSPRTGKPINEAITGRPIISLLGKVFGKLRVVSEDGLLCHCTCTCGGFKIVPRTSLKNSHTRSCGCMKQPNKNPLKQAHPRLYTIWCKMRDRCNNSNYLEYYLYGGRGIKVCKQWNSSFNPFAKWALATGYNPNLSIDRIDNSQGYCPENCRWATAIEQANNKRNNRWITVGNESLTVSQWAVRCNISRKTLQSQLTRNGVEGLTLKIQSILELI